MLGNLISAIILTTAIGIGGPLNTSTDYQDVNVTETYEYETNELSSADDLVVGNIYKYNGLVNQSITTNFLYKMNVDITTEGYWMHDYSISLENTTDDAYLKILIYNSNAFTLYAYYDDSNSFITSRATDVENLEFYFVYLDTIAITDISCISASDYLGEKTVTVTAIEYDGMFAIFTNFLYSRLFSGDVLTSMETTILGQTLTLGQWVSSSVAIVVLCLIVFMLVKFVIFLFKVVGGAFLWK